MTRLLFAANQPKKRRTVSSTVITILTNVLLPMWLSGLSYRFAMLCLSLSILIVLASWLVGYYLLRRSKRLRYLWNN